MYVSMKKMLQKANREKYAVMAINCFNLETAEAVIRAAEEMKAPVIIDLLGEHLKNHLSYEYLTYPIKKRAQKACVPVALNLDHGQDVAFVKRCIHEGFSSVMMDASMYDLEENIRVTRSIIEFSQAYDVSVEAEVGNMGVVAGNAWTNQQMYTDPKQAIYFIEKTNVDCLAISYGSTHGDYPDGYTPDFDFEIVKKIKEATNIPLVLHGGSGAGVENIKKSIKLGINKINVGSDFMKGQVDYLREFFLKNQSIDYPKMMNETIEVGKNVVKKYIELSGSANKI